jgi:Ca2+/Na+ antiporter
LFADYSIGKEERGKGVEQMEESRLRTLRQKQFLFTNVLYLAYILLVAGLIVSGASAFIIYSVLGTVFLISPLAIQVMKKPNPFLLLFPEMKELYEYEKEKLGSSWRSYHTANFFLQIALSIFFFIQAIFHDSSAPFMEGIPLWYFIVIPLILLYIGNMNLRFHIRRIDTKSPEQLKVYAYEKMLFSIVFASVAVGMTLIGVIVVMILT